MSRQSSFADLDCNHKKRRTRREVFLSEMKGVMPWAVLLPHIEPHYPRTGRRGRQPMALESMFRIYCLQNGFNLSDRQMEDALYEIESMRRFSGFRGVTDILPDETTILNFRHLLEQHELTAILLEAINAHSRRRGCWFAKARWWTPHSFMRQARPRIRDGREILRCIKRRRECNGTLV
ncbi:MAG: transposase [Proteobacteria bacterium]|nr:transposase [Pseudomonadota bacterium]